MVAQLASRRFFYGWIIVIVCSLTLLATFGIRLSFSIFFVALIEDFGWSRADTSLIFSVTMIVFMVVSPLAGLALDRFGARPTFTAGALFVVVGLLLSSRITTFQHLILTYGVITGIGITILGLGIQAAVIARWFKRKRGLAIGIAYAGTGAGSLLITPLASYLIELRDWRFAYLGLAILMSLLIPIIVIFLRLNPSMIGQRPDGDSEPVVDADDISSSPLSEDWTFREALRTPALWLLLLAGVGAIGPIRMLTVHQLAILESAGVSRLYGSTLIGTAGAVTAVTFVLSGWLSDRIGRPATYAIGSISLLGAYLILSTITSADALIALWGYVLLAGIGEGTRSSLVTAVASDLFPGSALGAVNGTVGTSFGLGAAILPWIAGRWFDVWGTYTPAFWVSAALVVMSTLCLWKAVKQSIDHMPLAH